MNIIVRSKTGGCNVAKHFIDNWVKNADLHPKVEEIGFRVHTGQPWDEIVVIKENRPIFHLKNHEALRLDRLQEFLISRL